MDEVEIEDDIKSVYWHEIFADRQGKHPVTLELKVVLYLYLMTREADYGYNIWKAFGEAKEAGKWESRTGLKDLTSKTSASKISAALKNMEELGILVKYEDIKKYLPKSFLIKDSIKDLVKDHPERTYYTINPSVISGETTNIDIQTRENFAKLHFKNLATTSTHVRRLFWFMIRIIQLYGKTEYGSIEYISKLRKFDYLSILLAFENLLHDFRQYNYRKSSCDQESEMLDSDKEFLHEYESAYFNDDDKMEQLKKNFSLEPNDLHLLSGLIDDNIIKAVRIERLPKK